MSMREEQREVYWRFNVFHRFIHLVMMITFLGLALTGLPLKYPQAFWSQGLISLWGGVRGAGLFHRWFAGITFGYFALHLLWVVYYLVVLKGRLLGPHSMVPSLKDFQDLYHHLLYFLGKGEPPKFGRFTYWEKFDYWAVFWGITFIGGSGLLLWFPEFFSRFLPGFWFNIAYTIHSDEALLAMGFIFVVHLFNAHLRAGVFPMDKSIFTGQIEAKKMMENHPLEWEDLNRDPQKREKRKVKKDLLFLLLILSLSMFLPAVSWCQGMTEEERMEAEKKLCLRCHRQPNLHTNEGVTSSNLFCMDCHGKKDVEKEVEGKKVSVYIDPKEYGKTVHHRIACVQCHEGVASSPHRTQQFRCSICHGYHGGGTAHDPHRNVNCEACHHESKEVRKDSKTGRIVLAKEKGGLPIKMTSHKLADFKDREACKKCHFRENQLGAPIHVLPAKSLICMGCHSSSVTLNDPVSMVSVFLFLIGIGATLVFWFQGTVVDPLFTGHEKISYIGEKAWQIVFSKKILRLLKVFVIDVLLLRRVLKESVSRWTIHSLIYLPIFARFLIGWALVLLAALFPMNPKVAAWLDKNHPAFAFLYDFLGLCILLGALGAILRRVKGKTEKVVTGGQDYVVVGLIGGILLTGFWVEGMRILLTALPLEKALPSFIGYPISLLLGCFPVYWEWVYPYGWYAHAILTGALVAYLPFSKMFHILISPLVVLIKSVVEER